MSRIIGRGGKGEGDTRKKSADPLERPPPRLAPTTRSRADAPPFPSGNGLYNDFKGDGGAAAKTAKFQEMVTSTLSEISGTLRTISQTLSEATVILNGIESDLQQILNTLNNQNAANKWDVSAREKASRPRAREGA